MAEFNDLTGQEFGIWKIIGFDHMKYNGTNRKHGMSYYKCECKKCGVIKVIARSQLLQIPNMKHADCGTVNNHGDII